MTRHLPPRLASASLAVALCGCMNMSGLSGSSSYACKAPDGVTCDSVSGTYANAVQNNLPSQRRRAGTPSAESANAGSAAAPSTGTRVADVPTQGLPPSPVTLRSSPRVLRLWFKPWEDADHDLYDQGYVYVQVDAGRWQIDHVQRQIREAYAPIKVPPRVAASEAKEASPLPANLKSLPANGNEGRLPGLPAQTAPRSNESTE